MRSTPSVTTRRALRVGRRSTTLALTCGLVALTSSCGETSTTTAATSRVSTVWAPPSVSTEPAQASTSPVEPTPSWTSVTATAPSQIPTGGSPSQTSGPATSIEPPSPMPAPTMPTTPPDSGTPSPVPSDCQGPFTIAKGPQDAGAGHRYLTFILTNRATTTCLMRGHPGVSIVGRGNGSQIGAAADRDTSKQQTTVTLAPGQATAFVVSVTQAANYPEGECDPTTGDGFRIYPPHTTKSIFVEDSALTGCAKTGVHLLTVTPVGVTG